ncbi:DUF1566 domain-containing protein [uncultured Bacteroides sp.]|uniref:fimbrial tip adhesin FimD n=1 Tax=uncultured Bacteroides sp. TaxID=162156 RepID=UPI00266662D6|nr:DUF1566 domain-containing protein [uncultured Bacteroides sp.]
MKKRNIIYSIVCTLFCFICLSCSDEKGNPLASSTETGLTLQINAGQNTFTRADGTTPTSSAESALDNVIHYLDVFIFDSETGQLVPNCYFHFGDGSNIVNPVCLISGNWKNRFQDHETCDVYVIANLHIHSSGNNTASETDLEQIQTLSDLQQLVDEYKNIYQSVSQDSKMPFTMSGYRMLKPAESSNVYTISVELTRLAAKIEISLDLKFTTDQTTINGTTYQYPTNDDIGQLQYSVHNYATNARVLPGNDDTFGYTIASAAETSLKFMDTDNSDNSVPKIIAYTYPTEWSNDILKETYVILNAQLKSTTDQGGDSQYMNNYYKIPLRLSTDDNKKLERNHWYKVKATITAKGNATPDKPVEVTNVQYEVAPWYDTNIDINGDTPLYLELSEYDVVMRNVDTYDLTFASSSQIVKDPTDVTSQKAEIEIKEIYYKNKYGKKIDLTNDENIIDNTYLSVEGGLNGHLVIHSPIPVNKTIRYITLTVKNAQYDESDQGTHSCIKTVTIKQYPLEYITGISGLYSYLDENTGAWPTGLYQLNYDSWAVDKNTEPQYTINQSLENSAIVKGLNGHEGLNGHIGDNKEMKSKFYVENNNGEGRIFRIDLSYLKDYEKVPAGTGKYNNVYTYEGKEKGNYTITATESAWGDYTQNSDKDYIEKNVDGEGGYTLEIKNAGKNKGYYSHSYISQPGGNYINTKDTDFTPNLVYYLEDNGTASNNQMYHVVITSTSGDYQLGRPIMSKDTDNKDIVDPKNPDNDKLVSPSFMLASQLGNSSTISWEDAKNQCKNYVEVGINGEVYDDWRLPTAAEINIIIKYQTNSKVNTQDDRAVMDYVLNYEGQSNPDYWVSSSNYFMNIPASGAGTLEKEESSEAEHRVRCVRDFHVGEPTE